MTQQNGDQDVELEKTEHSRRKEKKGRRRKKGFSASAMQEEESAHALLKLRGDTVYDVGQPYHDDDLAASMQLQAESSPGRPAASYEVESNISRHSDEINGDGLASKGRKKKRKRHVIETSLLEEDKSPDEGEDRPLKYTKLTRRSTPPPSAQSLDEINTEDEAIASYLREYENDQAIAPFSPFSDDLESEPELAQLAATFARERSPLLMKPAYGLPSRSNSSPSTSKMDRQKRKHGLDLELGGHDLPNGTGQHAFDDEAFEDYLSSLLNPANNYDQALSEEIPIDPQLAQNGDDPEQSLAGMEADFTESPGRNRKLSRVYSSRRRQPVEETSNSDTDTYALPYDGSPELDGGEQDKALPGIEDTVSQLSGEADLVGDFNRQNSSRSSSEVVMLPEKTPSPLAKRSKPRGNKTQQGGHKTKNHNPPLKQIAQKGGMFTTTEMAKLDALRDEYCREHRIIISQFNDLIHAAVRGNGNVKELWDSIHELFPYRTRMSVSRFCRRRFHNFAARGTWTPSEDEMLARAVAEKGKSWKAVGEMIDRFPEDCRDRYRNYHVNAANRNREHWTDAEIKNLCWAVYDCMMSMREEKRQKKQEKYDGREIPESEPDSDQEIEEMKLINWQAVSDRMGSAGGGRSRLQCSFKWGKLKNAQRDTYMREVRAVVRSQKQTERRQVRKRKLSWRLQRANKRLRNMKLGDRYDFLEAFSTCGATDGGNIPWKSLGDAQFRAKWKSLDRKAAWEMFKKEVPGSDAMDFDDVVNLLLTQLMAEHSDRLHERWNPDVDGDINVGIRRERKEKRKGKLVNGVREQSNPDPERYKSQALVGSGEEKEPLDDDQSEADNQDATTSRSPDEDDDHTEDRQDPDDADAEGGAIERDADDPQSIVDGADSEDVNSDDSLFKSNSDDSDDGGLFVSN